MSGGEHPTVANPDRASSPSQSSTDKLDELTTETVDALQAGNGKTYGIEAQYAIIKNAIEAAARIGDQWVSVKDRLPTEEDFNKAEIFIVWISDDDGALRVHNFEDLKHQLYTHWQCITPPKP